MTWLCLRNDDYRNCQMCIVTGPNIDIAIKLIKRMKGLFEPKLGLTFSNKESEKSSIEPVSEKYKIDDSVTIDKSRTSESYQKNNLKAKQPT